MHLYASLSTFMYNMRAITGAKNNHHFLFGVGIGYMAYRNNIKTYNILGTANMLGASFSLGYDCLLSKSFAMGIQVQYIAGQFEKIKWTDQNTGISQFQFLNNDNKESVNRIGISLGFRLLK